jgi:hypothetical protein
MLNTLMEFSTYGQKLEKAFAEHRHILKMNEHEETEALLKNQKLHIEVQHAQAELQRTLIENKIAQKNLEELLNDTKTKDRN